MKLKKIMAIGLLSAMLITSLAACGGNQTSSSSSSTPESASASSAPTEKITYEFIVFANEPADMQKVQDAINKITIPEINTEVELKAVAVGSYAEQVSLAIAGNEPLDLFLTIPMGAAHFNSLTAQNQLIPLDDLLSKYGTGIKEVLGENFLKGTTINGKIYGVTPYYGKATKVFCAMRTDLLEKYGLKDAAASAKSLSDIEAIYTKAHQSDPNMATVVSSSSGNILNLPGVFFNSDKFSDMTLYDDLGDSTNLVGVAKINDPAKVVSYYETPEVKAMYQKVNDWYKKGWVYKDAATTQDTCQEIVKQGNAFSYFFEGEVDAKTAQKNAAGYDMTLIEIATNPVQTGSIRKFTWAIPVTSEHKEAAMKFLNMTYTDERIVNLINYGIEGTHYKVNADKSITYADGVDATNSGWGLTASFLFGNQCLAKVWQGGELDIREKTKELNKTAAVSPLLGFSFDNSSVANQVSAITNVISQYRPGLQSGTIDPSKLDRFISALKAAGLDDYLKELQKQLDTFNSTKK